MTHGTFHEVPFLRDADLPIARIIESMTNSVGNLSLTCEDDVKRLIRFLSRGLTIRGILPMSMHTLVADAYDFTPQGMRSESFWYCQANMLTMRPLYQRVEDIAIGRIQAACRLREEVATPETLQAVERSMADGPDINAVAKALVVYVEKQVTMPAAYRQENAVQYVSQRIAEFCGVMMQHTFSELFCITKVWQPTRSHAAGQLDLYFYWTLERLKKLSDAPVEFSDILLNLVRMPKVEFNGLLASIDIDAECASIMRDIVSIAHHFCVNQVLLHGTKEATIQYDAMEKSARPGFWPSIDKKVVNDMLDGFVN
jgi:hypothetical protein